MTMIQCTVAPAASEPSRSGGRARRAARRKVHDRLSDNGHRRHAWRFPGRGSARFSVSVIPRLRCIDAASLRGPACNRTQLFCRRLNDHERACTGAFPHAKALDGAELFAKRWTDPSTRAKAVTGLAGTTPGQPLSFWPDGTDDRQDRRCDRGPGHGGLPAPITWTSWPTEPRSGANCHCARAGMGECGTKVGMRYPLNSRTRQLRTATSTRLRTDTISRRRSNLPHAGPVSKLHAMLADVARQVEWPVNGKMEHLSVGDWKAVVVASLMQEKAHGGRFARGGLRHSGQSAPAP